VYRNRKYAKEIDDLDDSSLGEKLVFLNDHGLQIFSSNLNKNLRNKVAHMDFDVSSDGKIRVKGNTYNLDSQVWLRLLSHSLSHILEELIQLRNLATRFSPKYVDRVLSSFLYSSSVNLTKKFLESVNLSVYHPYLGLPYG
jgi:hypothetical protein